MKLLGDSGERAPRRAAFASVLLIFVILVVIQANIKARIPYAMGWLMLAYSGGVLLALLTMITVYLQGIFTEKIKNAHLAEVIAFALLIPPFFGIIYWVGGLWDGRFCREVYDAAPAMYFSFVTWTTLGFGDYAPLKVIRAAVNAEAILGYMFMGLMIALFTFKVRKMADEYKDSLRQGKNQLCRDRVGAFWGGVCGALATRFEWSPRRVRAVFLVVFLVSSGIAVLAYLLLWASIRLCPEADTAET